MRRKRKERAPARITGRHFRHAELSYVISALLAAGATDLAFAREVPFSGFQQVTDSTSLARSVRPGDMDGDGDPDAVVASQNNDMVAWYENDGSAGGWTIHTITTAADDARDAFPADVDGDGDLDVVAASSYDDTIAWHENTSGDGSTWTAHVISTGIDRARSVFVADLDGDGDLDVISQSTAASTVYWHENGNAGGTWTQHFVRTGVTYAYNVSGADVDGDGDIDVLAAARDSDSVFWFQNDGSGGTWTISTVTGTADAAVTTGAADIDGDGDLDVLSGSYTDDKIAWYENDGSGSGWTIHTVVAGSGDARLVHPADVDNDGDVDLVTDFSGTSWFENDGTGTNWTTHTINGSSGSFVTSADIDVDGDLDVLAAGGNYVFYFTNDTIHRSTVLASEALIRSWNYAGSNIVAGDIDGDGDVDAVSHNESFGTIYWFANDGAGAEWTLHTVIQGMNRPFGLFLADVDGDGDMDVLSASKGDDRIAWHENNGGSFSYAFETISSDAEFANEIFAGDLDGDGDLDVLSGSQGDNKIAWYEHGIPGSPWTKHTITTNAQDVRAIDVSDVDGDGDLDVLGASFSGDQVAWYENDGSAGTWTVHAIATANGAFSLQAVDMDGDSDVDVLFIPDIESVVWYENDGLGGGWIKHTIATGQTNVLDARAADLDNDGDMDVMSNDFEDGVAWHENLGGGTSWSEHRATTAERGGKSIAAADVDGDGDLDSINLTKDISWHSNRGGQFALPTLDIAQKIASNGQTLDLLDIQAIHRGRTGDSNAELVTLELKLTDGAGVDLTNSEADNLIEELRVYLDDGSGVFEGAPPDTLVHTVSSFSLTAGVETITFGDGNANAQLPFGSPKVYFVVADITANADTQTPSAFQVGHVTESSSTAEDAPNDIALTLEFWPNTGTGVVDTDLSTASCQAPFDLALSNRTVTTTVACEAGTFIRAGDAFVVDSGGALSLSAGETIRFTSGFHVDTGTLTVTIDPLLAP